MNARSLLRVGNAAAPTARSSQFVLRQAQRRAMASDAFGQDLAHERQHHKDHAAKSSDLWRKVSLYGCLPFAIVMAVYIGRIEAEHLHHRDHEIAENDGELPETTKYEYNDMRKKVGYDRCILCVSLFAKFLLSSASHSPGPPKERTTASSSTQRQIATSTCKQTFESDAGTLGHTGKDFFRDFCTCRWIR